MTKKPFYMIMGFNTLLDWCYIMADMRFEEIFDMYKESLGYGRYHLSANFEYALEKLHKATCKYAWKDNRNEDVLVEIMKDVFYVEDTVKPYFTGKNYEFIRQRIDEHYEEMDEKFGLSLEKTLELWRSNNK